MLILVSQANNVLLSFICFVVVLDEAIRCGGRRRKLLALCGFLYIAAVCVGGALMLSTSSVTPGK